MKKIILIGVLILFLTAGVSAHEWYSANCCAMKDCHPIESCNEILEMAKGWVHWDVYDFSPDKIHPSQDGQCHVCIHDQPFSKSPICIYVQQGS